MVLVVSFLATPAWAKPVDINTTEADTMIEVMVGVGPMLGATIVDYRARILTVKMTVQRERVPHGTLSSHGLVIGIR